MGCGSHIPSVLDSVPESQWCSCGPQVEKGGKMYPPGGMQLSKVFLINNVVFDMEGERFADFVVCH